MIIGKENEEKNGIIKYPAIARGTSFTIPVFLFDTKSQPIASDTFQLYFTLKEKQFDYDYDDVRALVKVDAVQSEDHPERYDIRLTSKDTWQAPGDYFFDVMLKKDDDIIRLVLGEVAIVGGPSNRYQNDNGGDYIFGEPLKLGLYTSAPIHVTIPGTAMLRAEDMPLKAEPKFLLVSEGKNKVIKHYTSRLRTPMTLNLQKNNCEEFFIFDILTPFNYKENNPFGDLQISVLGEAIKIWSIPRKSTIHCYLDTIQDKKIGETINIPYGQNFTIRISFENHLLVIEGKHYEDEIPLMVEWFDFNK